jgi:hypothetical protein
MDNEEQLKKTGFITVTNGMSGYFAVHMWWNKELNGFWEPYQTGIGRYATRAQAELEAKHWAKNEEMPYVA